MRQGRRSRLIMLIFRNIFVIVCLLAMPFSTDAYGGQELSTWTCERSNCDTTTKCSAAGSAGAVSCSFSPTGPASAFNPNDPTASGYGLVFDDEFNTPATIDLSSDVSVGYNWYTKKFFGFHTTPSSEIAINNGIMTLNGTARGAVGGDINYALATAAPADNAQGFIGKAFSGGAYFEARLSFDPATVNRATGWPAFWSMAVQHMAQKGASQWRGQPPGYEHYIEDDFFEYGKWSGINTYTATLHDWYGQWHARCARGGCDVNNGRTATIKLPSTIDWNQFHTIGQLWVAGSGNGGTGYVKNYFDGREVSSLTWGSGDANSPPPSGKARFNIMDQQSLVLILGTGQNQPMYVDWVRVWQLPAAAAGSGNSFIFPQRGFIGANRCCTLSLDP